MIKFYICDTETTGLNHLIHEIFEISIIKADNRLQLTRQIKCERPETTSFDALKITNKTLADLEKGISREQAVKEANKFFSDDGLTPMHRCLVLHNLPFDKKFLHALWASVNQEFPVHLFLDTITLSKELFKTGAIPEDKLIKTATGKISTKLQSVCDMTGTKKIAEAHTAQADSRNTYFLWKKLIEEYKIDYIPHIKTFPHTLKDDLEDINLLDLSDVE